MTFVGPAPDSQSRFSTVRWLKSRWRSASSVEKGISLLASNCAGRRHPSGARCRSPSAPFNASQICTAQEKAELLQELAGGKNALRLNQALEAVALGCGFDRWRELVATNAKLAAGEANSLGIAAVMLGDDQHVDEETLTARRALQLETIRGVITCSHARAQELVAQWALSGSPHAVQTTPAGILNAISRESDNEAAIQRDHRKGDDNAGHSIVSGDFGHTLEESLNDAFFASTQEPRPDESPYPPSTPPAPVAVTYKKRRLPAGEG
ncbi:hypothetical protein AWB79_07477 [Caballeronia hypogeia]|uniref:Uncharacterized protein n=1 Tax=Caballeronia hypogeia TaxID=1777140 RepID=A0A158DUV0_9BURK|nr:hypothetical protein [Caballeronia hypogeia]SAK97487.1 hypothetical protein AWB79_07477 [Caballeronia hypogeia]